MNEKFKEILTEVKSEIFDDPNADLIEDGIIDSLDIMTIISKCEEAYEIDFDPYDILPENFSNVEAIWNLIEKYMSEGK